MVVGSNPVAATKFSDTAPVSSKEFFDIQATIGFRFTLKCVRGMIITCSQMHRTDKYSQHTQVNHLASFAKRLSVRLRTKVVVGSSLVAVT